MGCSTWGFIISVGWTQIDPGEMRFDFHNFRNGFYPGMINEPNCVVFFLMICRVLLLSSFSTRLGLVMSLHQWKLLGTFRWEAWKGCLRI